ncbi:MULTISPECIES: hypothetical protein [Acidobacteriaceae]|uniref:hypothetical protein n=1 Tax=Acidobacteriaceae TaxID=204434 RepID=UPI00131BFAB3|nr:MULTISPECIES: hypothetical protein [Acidobacteriaceae]MDW5265461.1 hypothetical protein [Edaphobacter sp.]
MSKIHVTIDRVVLGGLDATARHAFVTGLKTELAQALADPAQRAHWLSSRRTPVLRLGRVSLGTDAGGARKLGSHVAKSIVRSSKP